MFLVKHSIINDLNVLCLKVEQGTTMHTIVVIFIGITICMLCATRKPVSFFLSIPFYDHLLGNIYEFLNNGIRCYFYF